MPQQNDDNVGNRQRQGPSFTLPGLFIITLVASVMAAAGFYLARGIETGRQRQLAFLLFTLAAPVLLIVLVSSAVRLLNWFKRRQNRS